MSYSTPKGVLRHRVGYMYISLPTEVAPGMGYSTWPYAIYSWDGNFNTGTTHNGGGMRPPLSWKEGKDITYAWTRLTTPTEAVRVANLPHDYLDTVKSIKVDGHFSYECVNMGVPLRTASDLYRPFERVLREANLKYHVSTCQNVRLGP